jgi:hypothetical protein
MLLWLQYGINIWCLTLSHFLAHKCSYLVFTLVFIHISVILFRIMVNWIWLDALCIADVNFALVGQVFSSETVARQDEARHNWVHWYQRGAKAKEKPPGATPSCAEAPLCSPKSLAFLLYPVEVLVIFATLLFEKKHRLCGHGHLQ